jgi:rhodanese-related sulfurtransferase
MAIENLEPKAALDAMSRDPARVFVDVRTEPEYDAGHPAGSVNVPWALMDAGTGQMSPNADFVATMRKLAPAGATIYASCQSGVRSMNACKALEAAGWSKLVNVSTGFGGKRDPTGRVVAAGWRDAGLPVETTRSTSQQLHG